MSVTCVCTNCGMNALEFTACLGLWLGSVAAAFVVGWLRGTLGTIQSAKRKE